MTGLPDCRICGLPRTTIRFRKNGFNFIRCRTCDLVFVWPQPPIDDLRQRYDDFGKNYYLTEERIGIDFSLDHRERLKNLTKLVNKGKLLDVGCSTGSFLSAAKNEGWQVYGVEIARDSYNYVKDKLGLNVFCGNLPEAGFNSNYFDAVRIWGVLEHIPHPGEYLRESYRIIRPGGIIAISIPNLKSLEAVLLRKKYRYFNETHLWYFSPHAIKKILEKTGFRVEILFTEGFDPLLIWDDLREKPLNGINHCLKQRKIHNGIRPRNYYPVLRYGFKIVYRFINAVKKGESIVIYARKM